MGGGQIQGPLVQSTHRATTWLPLPPRLCGSKPPNRYHSLTIIFRRPPLPVHLQLIFISLSCNIIHAPVLPGSISPRDSPSCTRGARRYGHAPRQPRRFARGTQTSYNAHIVSRNPRSGCHSHTATTWLGQAPPLFSRRSTTLACLHLFGDHSTAWPPCATQVKDGGARGVADCGAC